MNDETGTQETNAEILHRGQWLELKRKGRWEYVSRVRERGAAFILAITDAEEVVLVEQYRTAVAARCLELPAGIIGDEAGFEEEALADAALRELEEETGFHAARIELLFSGPVAAGLTSELAYLFHATGLTRRHAGGGIGSEDIAVHLVPRREVRAWLAARMQAGARVDARIYAALWLAESEVQR